MVGLFAAALLAGIVVWAFFGLETAASRATLAVLPFENLSGDPDREYLADGLAEETIASLGQVDPDQLSVIGRTSMRPMFALPICLREIAALRLNGSSCK